MMASIKQGQTVTLKAECLELGEQNIPHVALEDSFNGTVKVQAIGDFSNMPFKPVNIWRVEWIAE